MHNHAEKHAATPVGYAVVQRDRTNWLHPSQAALDVVTALKHFLAPGCFTWSGSPAHDVRAGHPAPGPQAVSRGRRHQPPAPRPFCFPRCRVVRSLRLGAGPLLVRAGQGQSPREEGFRRTQAREVSTWLAGVSVLSRKAGGDPLPSALTSGHAGLCCGSGCRTSKQQRTRQALAGRGALKSRKNLNFASCEADGEHRPRACGKHPGRPRRPPGPGAGGGARSSPGRRGQKQAGRMLRGVTEAQQAEERPDRLRLRERQAGPGPSGELSSLGNVQAQTQG